MSRFSTIIQLPKNLIKRSMGSDKGVQQEGSSNKWKKFAFNSSGYNKYGLYSDDVINHEFPEVKEALRRLPKCVLDARNFRIMRAGQLEFLKMYLSKEKWITYEQDREYRYLMPYIHEVIAEKMEIREFGCVNYADDDWPADEIK